MPVQKVVFRCAPGHINLIFAFPRRYLLLKGKNMKKFLYNLSPIYFLTASLFLATVGGCKNGSTDAAADPNATPTGATNVTGALTPTPASFPTPARLMELGFQVFKEKVQAPDFTLKGSTGADVSLSSFRGKVVILNFWATWCPPCRAEMPSMERLYAELKDEGIELVAVDLQEPEKTVKEFIEENDYTFPVLLDSSGRVGAIYGARSIPTSFLIDAEGTAVAMVVGSREWDTEEIYAMLRSMVPKK